MRMHHKTQWRNRLISWFPRLLWISEVRRLLEASGRWKREGWFEPPPYFVRRAMLLTEATAGGLRILVETGTFLGDTTWAMKDHFRTIHTIEVEPSLAAMSKKRFRHCASVSVLEGDSAQILPELCRNLDGPCLFYLDGHYSGGITGKGETECPVIQELRAIFDYMQHPFRIVIDDARLFGKDPAYPDLQTVESFLARQTPLLRARVENDAIVIS